VKDKKKQQEQLDKAMNAPVKEKNWKQKKHEEKVFGIRNWVAKNNPHKGGKHKSKKDYNKKSLRQKLKQFIKGW